LGTPQAPTAAALRRYLAEFLWDPRVVEIPRLAWWPILHGIILRVRPAKSAAKYASIWMSEGSPLAVWTERQAQALAAKMSHAGEPVLLRHAMRYGEPALARVLDDLGRAGAERVLVLPLYPQYSAATTASACDAATAWAQRQRRLPALRLAGEFHRDRGYIEALASTLTAHWRQHGRAERLVLSFHGLPERTRELGDPYYDQCLATAAALTARLELPKAQVLTCFQSRFGRARWLEPYTEPTLRQLAAQGVKSVDVMCPGFVADCLETLEEIDQEARAAFLAAGGQQFRYVPCLNADAAWIEALAAIARRELGGWL
jgi:ferrochelatase